MKAMLVPIDSAGRIVLPKNVREELAIKPGDTFKVSVAGSTVLLRPNHEPAGLMRKGRALVFCSTGDATLSGGAVRDLVDSERSERLCRLGAGLAGRRPQA
ncbi:MAG: AbrB/MazE/SpoVT family DNA-binding domain-containing protein [Limisphaerales bacterium]